MQIAESDIAGGEIVVTDNNIH